MRRRFAVILTLFLALVGCSLFFVHATYSPDGRELISLGYLQEVFFPQAVSAGEAVYDTQDNTLYTSTDEQLKALDKTYQLQLGILDGTITSNTSFTDLRFKRNDVISLPAGSSFLLLAGEAQVSFSSGAVIDVSAGEEVPSQALLLPQHRYMTAEDTLSDVVILSDTAVLSVQGIYLLTPSTETDYNMLAETMKTMGLFKGSDTGFGSGFDLEKAPTRIQSLIMFLRLIGEEQAALASTAVCPFNDVPAWCQNYVSYAYEQGYTKGISATEFGPSLETRATEYLTFVLRALGYSDSGENPDFAWDTALFKALETGILTAREHKQLTEQPFLRAQVVYVSYYALDARLKNSGKTLYSTLVSSGALNDAVAGPARDAVTSPRMR